MATEQMTEAQRAYEARRAAKAGMSLDKWLDAKKKQRAAEARAEAAVKAKAVPEKPKKPGLFSRILERAQKPL